MKKMLKTMVLLLFCCASLSGYAFADVAVLPMVAKVLKLDPAVMASPFITTIVDAVSLLIYFVVAKALLKI